ncbi:MAG: alpha/beta hydrolase [Clostridiales bacterium]|nr:alpha/beta hydrolase [Clostridiales bacterium]
MKRGIKIFVGLFLIACFVCFPFVGCKKDERPQTKRVETENYIAYTDLAYGEHERQCLNLYLPKKTGKVGVYFAIHGGGWMAGDKIGYENELLTWCKKGYVAAALNYRYASLEDCVSCADMLDDITLALLRVKRTAEEHGIETHKALLTGGSAGAHLSMQYAYQKADIAPITPVAVCSLSGPTDLLDENYYGSNPLKEEILKMFKNLCGYDFDESTIHIAEPLLKQASPLYYVTQDSVPTILCHGVKDDIVPLSNAQAMDKRLTELGVKHDFVVYSNSGHGLEADPDCSARTDALLQEYAETYLI